MRTADGYMIRKCLDGDSAAFGLLVDKYKASIYALAYSKLRNFQDAEDVTQEVFITAYRKLRNLRRWDSFYAWLYSITSNLCKKLVIKHSKLPDSEFIEDHGSGAIDKLSIASYRAEMADEMLHDALDSLPEVYRQVLTLHYLGGMKGEEIAEFLGVSRATVKKRLSKARSELREEALAMMSTTFEQKRLQARFTFHIVETVKRIHPTPRVAGLPCGLSLATGLIATLMSLSPYIHPPTYSPTHLPTPSASPLPAETKVLKIGEIPVDVLKISQTMAIASKRGDGGGEFKPADERGDPLLAPQASEVKLKPRNGAAGDWFGDDVSLHGDYAIVGAPGKDEGKGVAYIFKRDGDFWKEQEMLSARDGGKEDYFGLSVAISDEVAVVGATGDDDMGEDTGSVYIFHRTGESWTEQTKLNPHGQAIKWCGFGIAVAISGDHLIVGSYQEEWAGGAIYIFKRDGGAWVEQAKLKSSNWARGDWFGNTVAILGDYVIAGAPQRDSKTGSTYIFKRDGDTWKEQALLTAKDGKADDWFGFSVSISDDYAIVGAHNKDSGKGAAYIFVREGKSWRQQAKILPDDLAVGDYFGASLCISGDHVIVSSHNADGGKGAIYGFMRDGDTWKQISRQTASDGVGGDYFGGMVAFSGNYAIISAWAADVNGADSGAAYIYHCTEDLLFPALPVENSGFSTTTLGGEKSKPPVIVVPIHESPLPSRFRLLQNFPNPFNPETWLPYELSSNANVTIWIHNAKGETVRMLNQGGQNAGSYTTKDKAAYWDGRDEAGDYVASGVYFYTIQAGDFVATKKMVVAR